MRDLQPIDAVKIPAAKQLRTHARQRVLKSAKIVLDNWRSLDCTMRDLSETGAKIRVDNTTILPKTFRILTTADNMIRDAEIAWKRNDEMGVIFTSAPKSCVLRKL